MLVYVYWNFHKKLWSVKSIKTGKVFAWRKNICLTNCIFKVSEVGRQRVLRERRKNVHAGVIGFITKTIGNTIIPIGYNPYKYSSFINKLNGKPVFSAINVCMNANGTVMAEIE